MGKLILFQIVIPYRGDLESMKHVEGCADAKEVLGIKTQAKRHCRVHLPMV